MNKAPLTFDESKLKELCSDILKMNSTGILPDGCAFLVESEKIRGQLEADEYSPRSYICTEVLKSMVAARAMEFVVNGY